jgi:Transcriptional regulator
MDNCERILELVQKNRNGITIEKIAKKLDIHVSSVYRNLDKLQRSIRVDRGVAFPIETSSLKKLSSSYGANIYYRILQEGYGCKAAGKIADILDRYDEKSR